MTKNKKKTSENLQKKSHKLFSNFKEYPFFLKRAKGVYLYDFDQNKYIDFYLNNGSLILGHAHPKITKYVKKYSSKSYISYLPNELILQLAQLILSSYKTFKKIQFYYSKKELFYKLITSIKRNLKKNQILFLGEEYKTFLNNEYMKNEFNHLSNINLIEDFIKNSKKKIGALCLTPFFNIPEFSTYEKDFFSLIKYLIKRYELTLILDEQYSGFRIKYNNFLTDIEPDVILLGPIIGGGFPLYSILSKNQIFDFSNTELFHPLYYISGIQTLKYLKQKNPNPLFKELINFLLKNINSKFWEIKTLKSIFSIKPKNINYQFNKKNKNLIYENLFLNLPLYKTQYLSIMHTHHDIKQLVNKLNKITQF